MKNWIEDFHTLQATEVEEAVIGALLLEKEALYKVIDFLKPEMFWNKSNDMIFRAILSLSEMDKPIDLLTVVKDLDEKNELKKIGGAVYVAELSERVASAAHVEYHARIVFQEFQRRKFVEVSNDAIQTAFDKTIDIAEIIPDSLAKIEAIENNTIERKSQKIGEIAVRSMKAYEERARRAQQGLTVGVHTGLQKLDNYLHGFQRGEVYILAGRPAMGKTAFALHIARKTAMKGNAVVLFSLEMTDISLVDRLVIADSGIDANSFKAGRLSPDEFISMAESQERISKLPIHVNDTASMTVNQIKAQCKKLKRKGKCDIVIIDYLQIIEMKSRSGKTTNDDVAACSRAIKHLAKDVDAPVVLLSQLSRKVEERSKGDRIPYLSDLRDSGAIEQDADVVAFIHREHYYDNTKDRNEAMMRIAKNRHGKTGDFSFWVNDTISDFKDEAPGGYNEIMPITPMNYFERDSNEVPF